LEVKVENSAAEHRHALVLLSGGIDSAACAYFFVQRQAKVSALFVDYGQAARQMEFLASTAVSQHLGIGLTKISVLGPQQFGPGEVLGRNTFLAFAALLFMAAPKGVIAMGLHEGTPYFDSSPQFVQSLSSSIAEQTNGETAFLAPFIGWSKLDVYDYFKKSKIPPELTYSCEQGTTPVCGRCGSCRDRSLM
jgi:7-cyano-7-deazaguanine synthase